MVPWNRQRHRCVGGLSEDHQEPLEDADQSHALLGGKWVFLGSRFLKFT